MLKLADGIRHFRLYCAILKEKGEETDVNLVSIGFRECHVHVQILLEEIIMCCDENLHLEFCKLHHSIHQRANHAGIHVRLRLIPEQHRIGIQAAVPNEIGDGRQLAIALGDKPHFKFSAIFRIEIKFFIMLHRCPVENFIQTG